MRPGKELTNMKDKPKTFICNECNQILLIELMSSAINICNPCRNAIRDWDNIPDRKARNKANKALQVGLDLVCELNQKTVNGDYITQLALF